MFTFPPGEDGAALGRAALRRETRFARWSKILLVAAFIAGPLWLIASAFGESLSLSISRSRIDPFSGPDSTELARAWAAFISEIANTSFVIAVGLFVVVWLHRRYRRRAETRVEPTSDSDTDPLAESRYARLVEDSDGYIVYRTARTSPERFADSDAGSDAAWDRFPELTRQGRIERWLRALVPIAVGSAVAWLALVLFVSVVGIATVHSQSSNNPLVDLATSTYQLERALYTLFAASTASYVVLWLSRRGLPPPAGP